MTKDQLITKLKKFCEYELWGVTHCGYDPRGAITRCYGAMMFVLNLDSFSEELGKWWDDEMLPRFTELLIRG